MTRGSLSTVGWSVLLFAAVLWAALILAAPWLGREGGAGVAGRALSAASYLAGSLVCHQRPERSFHMAGAQVPVCGRCTGLYVATAAGVLLALIAGRRLRGMAVARAWLLTAAAPSVATLALEWWGPWPVSNAVRAAAAVPLGLALGALMAEAAGFRGRL